MFYGANYKQRRNKMYTFKLTNITEEELNELEELAPANHIKFTPENIMENLTMDEIGTFCYLLLKGLNYHILSKEEAVEVLVRRLDGKDIKTLVELVRFKHDYPEGKPGKLARYAEFYTFKKIED
jgi:hypothetical protein